MRNTTTTAAAVLIWREVLKMYAVQIVRSCPIYTYLHSDNFMLEWGQWRVQRQETVSASLSLTTRLLRKGNKRYMSIEIIKPSPILLYRCRGSKNIYRDPLGQMITLKSWRIAFRNCQLLSSHRESIYYTWSVLTEDERVSVWIFRVIDEKTAAIIDSLQDCLTQSKAAS